MEKMLRNKKLISLYLIPALVVYVGMVFVPIIWSAYYSLFKWNGVTAKKYVGLDNFINLFQDRYFIEAWVHGLVYSAIVIVGQLLFALLIAVLLTKLTRGKELLKTIYFAPAILSAVALGQVFSKFLQCNPDGIINALLRMIGLDALAQPWLGQASTSLVTVALIECYKYMGLYVVILYSALISRSSDVIESAMIDGATGWTMFCKIKLPLISNVFVATLVMVVNGSLKAFDLVYITTNGGPGNSSELTATYMYRMAFTATKYGYGSAIAVFMAIQSILIVFVIRRAFSFTNRLEG